VDESGPAPSAIHIVGQIIADQKVRKMRSEKILCGDDANSAMFWKYHRPRPAYFNAGSFAL
jgi:hypothetical protein